MQAQCIVSSFYHLSDLCAKIGALNPLNNRNRCLLHAAAPSSYCTPKRLFFSMETFLSSENVSRLSRIIVEMIRRGSLPPDSRWALESKNWNFTHQACSLVNTNMQAQMLDLICSTDERRRKSVSLFPCNFASKWVLQKCFAAQMKTGIFSQKTDSKT